MCNRCNANAFSRTSCGYNYGCNCCGSSYGNGCGGFWNTSFQSMCRDACGNIYVNNGRCGYNNGCYNGYNNGCLYGVSAAQTSGTQTTNCTQTTNTASGCGSGCGGYYARQYCLTPTSGCCATTFGSCTCARRRSSSGCGFGYGYGFDIEDSDDTNG